MSGERYVPKDDRELESMTGIRHADHHFVSRADYEKARRQMLGPSWGKRRREPPEQKQSRLRRFFGFR